MSNDGTIKTRTSKTNRKRFRQLTVAAEAPVGLSLVAVVPLDLLVGLGESAGSAVDHAAEIAAAVTADTVALADHVVGIHHRGAPAVEAAVAVVELGAGLGGEASGEPQGVAAGGAVAGAEGTAPGLGVLGWGAPLVRSTVLEHTTLVCLGENLTSGAGGADAGVGSVSNLVALNTVTAAHDVEVGGEINAAEGEAAVGAVGSLAGKRERELRAP